MIHKTPLIDTLKQAAQAAGEILREGYQAAGTIDFQCKGASDFVTDYDRAAERAIIDTVRRHHPEVGFLGEETGATPAQDGTLVVVIDPLDGTNNFLHRVPHFSVSIAVQEGNQLTHGWSTSRCSTRCCGRSKDKAPTLAAIVSSLLQPAPCRKCSSPPACRITPRATALPACASSRH